MKKILVYEGKGADPFSVSSLYAALKQEGFCQHYQIEGIKKEHFDQCGWYEETYFVIFPGGRDVPYHFALRGSRNQVILDFVEQGGHFLGICAGAYYGSGTILFEKGGPLEVTGTRELQFFKGRAEGPVYGPNRFCYGSQQGAQIAHLRLNSGKPSFAYYNGGCAFIGEELKKVEVLACYEDLEGSPAAIIRCPVGKGYATLCGVHPEYSAYHAFSKEVIPEELLLSLKECEEARREVFRLLF